MGTLRWGGGGFALAAAMLLTRAIAITLPVSETAGVALSGWGFLLVTDLVLLASMIVLAVGLRGEPGIVAGSRLGQVALVVMGAQDLGFSAIGLAVPPDATEVAAPLIVVNMLWQLAAVAAAIVAAVVVARAGVLQSPARWLLVPVAALQTLLTGLQLVPVVEIVPVLSAIGLLLPLALLVAGGGIAASGFGFPQRRAVAIPDGGR